MSRPDFARRFGAGGPLKKSGAIFFAIFFARRLKKPALQAAGGLL